MNVKDLRSMIAKEACETVGCLARNMGHQFRTIAEPMMQTLLTLTYNSTKAISEPACECIVDVLTCTDRGFNRVFAQLFKATQNRNTTLAAKAAEYVTICCEQWSHSFLERRWADLESCLMRLLKHSDPKARSHARCCFVVLENRFPSRMQALFKSLSRDVQRLLEKESANYQPKAKAVNRSENKNIAGSSASGSFGSAQRVLSSSSRLMNSQEIENDDMNNSQKMTKKGRLSISGSFGSAQRVLSSSGRLMNSQEIHNDDMNNSQKLSQKARLSISGSFGSAQRVLSSSGRLMNSQEIQNDDMHNSQKMSKKARLSISGSFGSAQRVLSSSGRDLMSSQTLDANDGASGL